jgi:CheY-like chemotaxis protein
MAISTIKSVLVVDDSRLSRMLISKYIRMVYPDWIVIEASNGQEAVDKVKVDCPNYITMDYNMEGMNGGEAARQILQFTSRVAIVLFTANIQSSTRSEAEALGIHFVGKPVTEQTIQLALDYFVNHS